MVHIEVLDDDVPEDIIKPTLAQKSVADIDEDDDEVHIEEVDDDGSVGETGDSQERVNNEGKGLYHVLGVCEDASPTEIDEAYRMAIKDYSPDQLMSALGTGDDGETDTTLRMIMVAFKILSDANLRKAYDKNGMKGVEEYENKQEEEKIPMTKTGERDAWLAEAEAMEQEMKAATQANAKCKVDDQKRAERQQMQSLEGEYKKRREGERKKREEETEKKQEAKLKRWDLEQKRALRKLESEEDDLLAFLDADRFGKK